MLAALLSYHVELVVPGSKKGLKNLALSEQEYKAKILALNKLQVRILRIKKIPNLHLDINKSRIDKAFSSIKINVLLSNIVKEQKPRINKYFTLHNPENHCRNIFHPFFCHLKPKLKYCSKSKTQCDKIGLNPNIS